MMPAYMIVRVNVTDMDQYAQYMKLTPPVLEKFGGEFVIRGGREARARGTGYRREDRGAQVR